MRRRKSGSELVASKGTIPTEAFWQSIQKRRRKKRRKRRRKRRSQRKKRRTDGGKEERERLEQTEFMVILFLDKRYFSRIHIFFPILFGTLPTLVYFSR